ncbi:hypothetical protein QFC20_007340 [Naganishia adeliensis]|uniref:Uncharacterized protein n=1 Tax=Naganishia adeliensis TaxID=92952 RepID=A0ACC2UZW7_9TREE|nr:hypothetical protein QFC20_007340 [Naganishia adeliensis]
MTNIPERLSITSDAVLMLEVHYQLEGDLPEDEQSSRDLCDRVMDDALESSAGHVFDDAFDHDFRQIPVQPPSTFEADAFMTFTQPEDIAQGLSMGGTTLPFASVPIVNEKGGARFIREEKTSATDTNGKDAKKEKVVAGEKAVSAQS